MTNSIKTVILLASLVLAAPAQALDREDRQERRDARESRRDLVVPARCLQSFATRAGSVSLYTADCLREGHIEVRELPETCRVTFRAEGQRIRAYEPDCLAAEGYRLAGQ